MKIFKINIRIKYKLLVGCLLFLIFGCGPSEEEIRKSAEVATLNFVDELRLQNFNSASAIYPDLRSLSKYKLLPNFKITRSSIASSNKKEVIVLGEYGVDGNAFPVQFVLGETGNGQFKIIKSKGLTSYYDSPLFNLLKRSGCFSDIESDAVIHRDCQAHENDFELMVSNIKREIEQSITFVKNGSNLANNSNVFFSGELTLNNNSIFNIPMFAYEIYIVIMNKRGEVVHSSKYEFNHEPILANSYHQITVYTIDFRSDYHSYNAVVQITNDQFIRDYLSIYGMMDCQTGMLKN